MNELFRIALDQHEWCELFKLYKEFKHRVPDIIENDKIGKDSDGHEFVSDISDKCAHVNDAFRNFFRVLFHEMSLIEYQCECKDCSPRETKSVSKSYEVNLDEEHNEKSKLCKLWRFCEIIKNHPSESPEGFTVCDKCKN